ncbi:Hypothetical protein R9X50_00221100 [Acrodontium crateriforme]|uniref:Monopolin complex subunit Csm1/Pcs1 C-terminal domain-containing protein n=1 Tax=Acrodontium crateriforme TaxID=150365 RepID=A0AAQ3RAQ9_9PEZI|nr:Hypothetical protein R9X50_00221100 [Acrodontium crateriforme]
MPSKAKAQQSAIRAGASDSEDDLAAAAASGVRTTGKTKMTKAAAAKPAPKRKAPTKQSRPALKDRTNMQDSDVEDFEEEGEEEESAKPKAKRAKTTASKKAPASRQKVVIPETQPDPDQTQDIEESIEEIADDMDVNKAPTPVQAQRFVQRPRSTSVQPLSMPTSARSGPVQSGYPRARERSGSASATERRGGDPEMRRKLNEMTKKYENVNLKYQNLQEIGKSNADTNFEKLKRASDQKAKDANELIASLKKEIAELRKSTSSNSSESQGLQRQVTTLTTSNERLLDETTKLKDKLQASQNEQKALEAKLVAARQQMTNLQEKGAASAQALTRSVLGNTTDSQKEAKMKENLYSDLTGLIIRNVKRKEGEDEYDCIQTGRNGTLHFHLSVANDASITNPKTPTGLSYEEAEFAYEPFLDEGRDRELLDILPDYLSEEICFPRNQAPKFFSKIMDNMTKKIVVEE